MIGIMLAGFCGFGGAMEHPIVFSDAPGSTAHNRGSIGLRGLIAEFLWNAGARWGEAVIPR